MDPSLLISTTYAPTINLRGANDVCEVRGRDITLATEDYHKRRWDPTDHFTAYPACGSSFVLSRHAGCISRVSRFCFKKDCCTTPAVGWVRVYHFDPIQHRRTAVKVMGFVCSRS